MKTLLRVLFVSVLCVAAGWAVTVVGQPGGGGPPPPIPCAFDCYEIIWMGGRQNGVDYCWNFPNPTGRLVWSNLGGPTGGTPVQDPFHSGQQTVLVFPPGSCPSTCNYFTEIPQELTHSVQPSTGVLGFGRWVCSG